MSDARLQQIAQLAQGEPLADRSAHLRRLADSKFDILVIGGGATGAGVALDAVTRGFSVGLIEKADFASGTSSRSSKMIHGGFRYMQTGDVALVRESLRERTLLQSNAPHLVSLLPFLIPLFLKGGLINPKVSRALGAALWSYQFAGSWRIGRRHRRLKASEVLAHMPVLDPDKVGEGYLFHDLRTDDARLTLAIAATAAAHGAAVANHAECVGISDVSGGLRRVSVKTAEGEFTVAARMVVNATGIWAGELLGHARLSAAQGLVAAKGTHLVFPRHVFGNDVAVSLPTTDRRTMSVVDAGAFSYVGSTDTTADCAIDEPGITQRDIDYVLAGINRNVTRPLSEDDITGGWSGFRPLLADQSKARTADLSRKHRITLDADGFVSVTGGKLTTYRAMAEEAVDVAAKALGGGRACRTRKLRLHGASSDFKFSAPLGRLTRYGVQGAKVAALAARDEALARPITKNAESLIAEAVWGLHAEMAGSLEDVLMRRTRVGLFDGRAVLNDLDVLGGRIMDWTDWSPDRRQREIDATRRVLRRELGPLAASSAVTPPIEVKDT